MESTDHLNLFLAPEQPGGPSKPEMLETAALAMPLDERNRATFLLTAGLLWQGRREYDAARRCYGSAIALGGRAAQEGLAGLLQVGFLTEDRAAVDAAAHELLGLAGQRPLLPSVCFDVATAYECEDLPQEALRWYSIPLSYFDPADREYLGADCLEGRYELRRQLGLSRDAYDEAALEAMDRI